MQTRTELRVRNDNYDLNALTEIFTDARSQALDRLVVLLEEQTVSKPRKRIPVGTKHLNILSQEARLRAARAHYVLASLQTNGRIERVSEGAFFMHRPRPKA